MKKLHRKIESPLEGQQMRATKAARREVAGEDVPLQEEIAALAYSYWEARGHRGGSPDWLRAEEELRTRLTQQKTSEKPRPRAVAKGAAM